jgi:hypothetical protein
LESSKLDSTARCSVEIIRLARWSQNHELETTNVTNVTRSTPLYCAPNECALPLASRRARDGPAPPPPPPRPQRCQAMHLLLRRTQPCSRPSPTNTKLHACARLSFASRLIPMLRCAPSPRLAPPASWPAPTCSLRSLRCLRSLCAFPALRDTCPTYAWGRRPPKTLLPQAIRDADERDPHFRPRRPCSHLRRARSDQDDQPAGRAGASCGLCTSLTFARICPVC